MIDNNSTDSETVAWLAERLSGNIAVALDSVDELQGHIYPEEDALLGHAIEKRAREFRAGRTAARKCMLELGMETGPILMGAKNEPLWPEGCVGTISHCGKYCLAIVSSSHETISLGADIEHLGRVKPHLWPRIFVEREKEFLGSLVTREADRAATAMFSAKEAFFKLQYPLTGNWMEFLEAEVTLEPENQFRIEIRKILPDMMPGQVYRGSFVEWQDCCITVMGIN